MATVHLPNSVIAEIEELGEEIAKKNPPAAFDLMDRIHERCASLDEHPARGALYREHYRRVFVDPYQIIYKVDGNDVYVLTVRHMSRMGPRLQS
jgi:plasmid stabilization system protein ParE